MKKLLPLLFLIFLFIFFIYFFHFGRCKEKKTTLNINREQNKTNFVKIEKNPTLPISFKKTPINLDIKVGEHLDYSVSYFGIGIIRVSVETKEITKIDDISCYHIIATAQPKTFFKLFKNIKYEVHSYIDKENYRPVMFLKYKIRGKKITKELIKFLPSNIAIVEITDEPEQKIPIYEDTYDLLSFFYYFRALVKEDKSFTASIIYNGKIWPVSIEVKKPQELKYKGEKIKVFKIQPSSPLISYISKRKKLILYITADKKHTPLIFELFSDKGLIKAKGILKQFLN